MANLLDRGGVRHDFGQSADIVCVRNVLGDVANRCSRKLEDFSDTAGLIENLDLVISVCTSVAHLAGAMGKPLWVLLSYNAEWRWLLDRSESPWYPTARLFRQNSMQDWSNVLAEVGLQLNAME